MYVQGKKIERNDKCVYTSIKGGRIELTAGLIYDHCAVFTVSSKANPVYSEGWEMILQEGNPWTSRRK